MKWQNKWYYRSPVTTGLKVTHKQEGKEGGKDNRVKFNCAIILFGLIPLHPAFHISISRLMLLSFRSPSNAFEIQVGHWFKSKMAQISYSVGYKSLLLRHLKTGCHSPLPISHLISSVTDNAIVFYFSISLFIMLIKGYKTSQLH